jgi:hypothetical protein
MSRDGKILVGDTGVPDSNRGIIFVHSLKVGAVMDNGNNLCRTQTRFH